MAALVDGALVGLSRIIQVAWCGEVSLRALCSGRAQPDEALPAALQTGEVVDVVRELDVRLSTGEVRHGVPSTALRPVLRFQPDQHVLHANGYLGRIEEVPCPPLTWHSAPLRAGLPQNHPSVA